MRGFNLSFSCGRGSIRLVSFWSSADRAELSDRAVYAAGETEAPCLAARRLLTSPARATIELIRQMAGHCGNKMEIG